MTRGGYRNHNRYRLLFRYSLRCASRAASRMPRP